MSSNCCCPEAPNFSDNPGIVFSVYVVAFIPLAFIHASDFIKDKWLSIRDTRRNGFIQLFLSCGSLAYVLYYIQLLIKDGDYKEAAAAIVVAFITVYHVSRTIWGLVQLYEFRNWNIRALMCLLDLGYSAPIYEFSTSSLNSDSADVNGASKLLNWMKVKSMYLRDLLLRRRVPRNSGIRSLSLKQIKMTVDYHMVVNSSLVDNEFFGNELPVVPAISSRKGRKEISRHGVLGRLRARALKSKMPEECSVRWLVAFLAKFGYKWLADTKPLATSAVMPQENFKGIKLKVSQNLAVLSCLQTTHEHHDHKGELVTLLSPLHNFCVHPEDCRTLILGVQEQLQLPFGMKGAKKIFHLGEYAATIRDAAEDDWHKPSLNKLDPTDREAVLNISAVQLSCFAKLMRERFRKAQSHDWQPSCFSMLSKNYVPQKQSPGWEPLKILKYGKELIKWDKEDPRVETWMYQLGYDNDKDYKELFRELPIRKEFAQCLLWKNTPNRLLFQASAHVDNLLALDSGNRLNSFLNAELSSHDHCGFQPVFDSQYNLEIGRLRSDIPRIHDSKFKNVYETARFVGCVAETVRSMLATWTSSNETLASDIVGWKPDINKQAPKFFFTISRQLMKALSNIEEMKEEKEGYDDSLLSVQMRLMWEAQYALQSRMSKLGKSSEDIRKCVPLIMLFILGFPSLKARQMCRYGARELDGGCEIEFQNTCSIEPVGGPQELKLVLRYSEEKRKVCLELQSPPDFKHFEWQMWKDGFMGRLAAQKHWRSTRLFSGTELLLDQGRPSNIADGVRCVPAGDLRLPYDLTYWEGWPPHIPQIAFFEMIKLCELHERRDKNFPGYERAGPSMYTIYIGRLNTALNRLFQSDKECASIFRQGQQALGEGKYEEALRMFGRCIADNGHKGALTAALDLLLGNHLGAQKHEVLLRSKMAEWFKAILRREDDDQDARCESANLEFLAECFGRLYGKTWQGDALRQKVLALFHTRSIGEPVSLLAIEAAESFLISEPMKSFSRHLDYYLAIAHQSHFQNSANPAQRDLSAKYWKSFGSRPIYAGRPIALSVAYLLEKGCFVGREASRAGHILSYFCKNEGWGDGSRMVKLFEHFFVKHELRARDAESIQEQSNGYHSKFGIGQRPADAIEIYNTVIESIPGQNSVKGQALNRWGLLYHKGAKGILVDTFIAREKYSEAIRNGNEDAQCNMSILMAETPNFAIMPQTSSGMNNLAVSFELGRGVERDVLRAEELYKDAIALDKTPNPIAMYNLSLLYIYGFFAFRSDSKKDEADRMLSELQKMGTKLAPLMILRKQIERITKLKNSATRCIRHCTTEQEEIGDCLAYVKILLDI